MSKQQDKGKKDESVFIRKEKSTSLTPIVQTSSKTSKTEERVAKKPLFICEYCEKQFPYASRLKQHKVIHTGQNDYKCNLCEYSASQRPNLYQHILGHVNERPFVCKKPGCQAAFKNSTKLARHQLVHRKNDESLKQFTCPQCTFKTCWKDNLTKHNKTVHSPLKELSCPQEHCKYSAKRKSDLNRHLKYHSSKKRHVCPHPYCGYNTDWKHGLKSHMKTHSPEAKMHKCNYCGYASHRYDHLIQHIGIHTLETPYSCDSCQYKSRYQSNVTKHMKKHLSDLI